MQHISTKYVFLAKLEKSLKRFHFGSEQYCQCCSTSVIWGGGGVENAFISGVGTLHFDDLMPKQGNAFILGASHTANVPSTSKKQTKNETKRSNFYDQLKKSPSNLGSDNAFHLTRKLRNTLFFMLVKNV